MLVVQNISLKPYNTFGIDVLAKDFCTISSLTDLIEILNSKAYTNSSKLIIGGGSNILFTKNFEGLVLKNELKGISCIREDADYYYIKAAAGEAWHDFVLYCIEHNYAGVENLSLIPGMVGASPMQNIGAYGVEIKDVFESLEAYHIKDNTIKTFTCAECEFDYRESVFKTKYKDQFIILNVTYKLRKIPRFNTSYGAITQELERMGIKELSIKSISQAIIHIRNSKLPDPKIIGNAGSFFQNPIITAAHWQELKQTYTDLYAHKINGHQYKVAAGWLIEKCGWKGYRKNDAGCNPLQALVLVNYGHATGQEILDLSEEITQSINNKFHILLKKEVNIL